MRNTNDRLIRLAKFLILGNLICFAAGYVSISTFSQMHDSPTHDSMMYGGFTWEDSLRLSLYIVDTIAAYIIVRGGIVFGIVMIGMTSTLMMIFPIIANIRPFSWVDLIACILYYWDTVALIYLMKH